MFRRMTLTALARANSVRRRFVNSVFVGTTIKHQVEIGPNLILSVATPVDL